MSIFPVPLSGTDNTLMWAEEAGIEEAARAQLRNVAALPWTRGVRVMPDVHYGLGATVGSVIAMSQAVAPAAVGVDIGCGMTAVRTNLRPDQLPEDLAGLRHQIERAVPVGFSMHNGEARTIARHPDLKARYQTVMGEFQQLYARDLTASARTGRAEAKAGGQVGTLGGGNHFIELCSGDDGRVWVTLHSGSRGTGNQLAQVHMGIAQGLAHNQNLADRDLAVFIAGSPQMEHYLHDLWWAQAYALLNRDVMLAAICDELSRAIDGIAFEDPIRCHHNYVAVETHDGEELIVTRKGAIRAGAGDMGVIPGSMGTGSYIVTGLGNETSYQSASHGAGRRMSRRAAKRTFTADDLAVQTAGIECRKDTGVIDEIPAAYKDIDDVIAAQTDLVSVVARLQTLLCVKG
ncbi:RtcB family protein [Acidipropionibacterium acidipropionici]|jgi:tRNA-splicing ligase RtcB|uniref:RtcB family protein n=1 Tax=Acidipropionibacterium acidipropionici TaxID=1748 RepID=UPI0004233EBA|nr:RtcB family protein [Acidipropionibacterium acidipropionici]ALN14627.1 Fis family transcriptional regulator [Acidipropionibacterium acidipropionici]APZ09616.1 RNA-splicing ligase RtcB [Acidipropionibacterium acidipropionici]